MLLKPSETIRSCFCWRFLSSGMATCMILHDNLVWETVSHHGINPYTTWDKGNADSWDEDEPHWQVIRHACFVNSVLLFVCSVAPDLVGCRQVHVAHGIAFGSISSSLFFFVSNLQYAYIVVMVHMLANNTHMSYRFSLKPIHWPTQPLAAYAYMNQGLFYPIYAACVELDIPLCLQALLAKIS